MADEIVVKNTVAFQFPKNAAQPTVADMGRFIKSLNSDRSKMDTAYKISDEKSVFIRFKYEDAMKFCLENNETTLPFRYIDGKEVMVTMSVAGDTRYVRVFDLQPEVTDADLSSVLSKYGTIKRIVRERFPADSGLDIFSGVRGLYMDIQSEIPEILFFRGRKGRLFYQGVKLRCHICKSDAHLKKVCPIFKARQETEEQQPVQQNETQSPPARSLEEGTGEAAAPVPEVKVTRKQNGKSKGKKISETKRQLSVDSDTNSQPQQKKKVPFECESDDDECRMITEEGNSSDTDTNAWLNFTPEERQAWFQRRERRDRILDKKIERYLEK